MTAAATAPAQIDGVMASRVITPRDVDELAAALREGGDAGEAVVFRTFSTKLDWGQPPQHLDTIIDLSQLPAEIDHAAGDLVVRVSASVGLAALNERLALAGQRLALDEVVAGSSIGGVLATGLSGPLRLGFGTARDLLLGISIVRADGVRAKAGGRVVKNVAGYDLSKLFTGSYGTLGAITEAYFRLHPLPEARSYLSVSFEDEMQAGTTLRRLAASKSAPAAIELERDDDAPVVLTVLLEGSPTSLEQRVAELASTLHLAPRLASTPPEGFGALPGIATLKLTFSPGDIGALLRHLATVTARLPGAVLRGAAAVGVLYLGVDAAVELSPLLGSCRELTATFGGATTVLRAPRAQRAGLDVWGPVPAPGLQQAVKRSFDPTGRLAPGRFVRGL